MSLLLFFSLNFSHWESCFLVSQSPGWTIEFICSSTFNFYHVASCFPVSNLFRGTSRLASFKKCVYKMVPVYVQLRVAAVDTSLTV